MPKNLTKIISKIITVSLLGTLLGSCAKAKFTDLPLMDSSFTKSKITANKKFGFNYDAMPAGVQNVGGVNPTEFNVDLFITNNQDCKFIYLKSKDGKKDTETETTSFKAYLSEQNILLKVICAGEASNVDYKITAEDNGVKYTNIGNLSYFAESSDTDE